MLGLLAIWAAITSTLGLLTAFARTAPDEAYSNLTKWLGTVRFHRAQQWLKDRAVDRLVLRYGRWVMIVLLFSGGMIFQDWLSQGHQLNSAQWESLTKDETAALQERVQTLPPEDIVVACETINCKDLADGLANIFQNATGWKVTILHRGGMDITGVTGIQIDPNEPATVALKNAIESATTLKVTMGPDTRKDVGSNQSTLVVGNKPF
jgi:hypothetical protein